MRNDMRYSRDLSDQDICPSCHMMSESVLHSQRDCPCLQPICSFFRAQTQNLSFFNHDLKPMSVHMLKAPPPLEASLGALLGAPNILFVHPT